jgi:signal transduction histidine kinase
LTNIYLSRKIENAEKDNTIYNKRVRLICWKTLTQASFKPDRFFLKKRRMERAVLSMPRVLTIVPTPLALLRLSFRIRLGLVGVSLVLTLSIVWLWFPTPFLDFLMIFPLVLACWLFRWRGGFLCLGLVIIIEFIHYNLSFGSIFWESPWGMFLLTRIVASSLLCLIVAGLRHMTDALVKAQHTSQQAHILNEVKDQVLYSLSHELRTPLTQVLGYLDLIEHYHEHLDAKTQAQYITYARSGCEEVLDLLSNVLETARTSTNDRPLHLQTFALRHELQSILTHLDPYLLEEHPVKLLLSESLQVYAEPRFVRQIIRNLLTNAFKYTPPHTPIQIKAVPDKQPELLCVQVSDAGPGISLEDQSLLFQPFVRLKNASAGYIPGTGLGLAICKQLVEAMGGRIWVESRGRKGEGCCFSFTLRLGTEPGAVAGPQDLPSTEETLR